MPRLTAHERARTKRIVARDSRFMRIVGAHRYVFEQIGVWTTGRIRRHGVERKIGAVLDVAVKPPRPLVVARFPLINYDKEERSFPPYKVRVFRLTVNLKELMILVDLTRGRVVSIEAGEGSVVIPPPNTPRTPPTGD
jgi:hypothetical protein